MVKKAEILQNTHTLYSRISTCCFSTFDEPVNKIASHKAIGINFQMVPSVFYHLSIGFRMKATSEVFTE